MVYVQKINKCKYIALPWCMFYTKMLFYGTYPKEKERKKNITSVKKKKKHGNMYYFLFLADYLIFVQFLKFHCVHNMHIFWYILRV